MFGRSDQPYKSGSSSTYSYGDPNSYYSNSVQSGYDSSNRSFQGQPPPPEGYFAPAHSLQAPDAGHHLTERSENRHFRDPLPSPPSQQYTSPYQREQLHRPFPPRHSSMSPQPATVTPPPTRKPDPPTRGRFYADNLRLRSRSPKHFAPHPNEKEIPTSDASNPAYGLGIFRAQPPTSRTGDQERPWNITIPGDANTNRRQSRIARKPAGPNPPTVDESSGTSQAPSEPPTQAETTHPHRGEARAINEAQSPIELPVTKDDSSDEILMTSTAYPGQEWKPAGFGGWENY